MSELICAVILFLIYRNTTQILKVLRLKRPGKVTLSIKGENDMLKFVLDLPSKAAPDVVSRELKVVIDGVETFEALEGDAITSTEYAGADNAVVTGSLVDVDDAGNRSEASEFSYVLVDTIAPPAPGMVGLRVTAEE